MIRVRVLWACRLLAWKRTLLVRQCEKLWLAFWHVFWLSVLQFCGVSLRLRMRWCPCLRLGFVQELEVPDGRLSHGCGADSHSCRPWVTLNVSDGEFVETLGARVLQSLQLYRTWKLCRDGVVMEGGEGRFRALWALMTCQNKGN
ncbi:hypothetical protein PSPO01_01626 [Paraphaeosphaeria sporulosa]